VAARLGNGFSFSLKWLGAVGQAYSFASFGLFVGLCGLQMCMTEKRWHYYMFK